MKNYFLKKESKNNSIKNESPFSGYSVLILVSFCIRTEVLRESFESSSGVLREFSKDSRSMAVAIW